MKILVIGGTKFIGKYICESFLEQGHAVTVFNRGKTSHSLDVRMLKGDIENLVEFKDQFLSENFDVVVHCIAYFESHASDLVSIFEGTNTHLIVLSSGDSYEAFQGLNRKKDLAELPVTENSPLSSMKYYWSDSAMKGDRAAKYDKNLMTDILMEANQNTGLKVTVFRLSMIYGPDDYQYPSRHGAFIRRIIDKRRTLVLSDREQCSVYTYGYVENIAAAITHSLGKEITFGKIYNLGETKSRSRRRWVELYSKISNWRFDIHVLPEELLRKDKFFRSAPPQLLLTDSSLFCRETGFEYPISLEEAVKKTLNYAVEHPEVLDDSNDYSAEDRLLETYYSKIEEIHSLLD